LQTDLNGRVAVVFGATRDLGQAIAIKLAAAGARVVVQGRDEARGRATEASATGMAGTIRFVAGDLYDYSAVDRVLESATSTFGPVQIVVASGGTSKPRPKPFLEYTPDELPSAIVSGFHHRLFVIHAAAARMRAAGYGKIVSITTDAGRIPTPAESLVGANAAALIFLTRALARELAPAGIRINAISTTLTSGTTSYRRHQANQSAGEGGPLTGAFAKLEARAPFGRLNNPNDLAELALYLCAPESDQLTGATVSLNGGTSFPAYA
jgi:2-hydroxycyclohexanecarboxyl-CoA dehydrogenase